jgi:uncharacterized protein (PEP-CTERM system associated)
VKARRRQAPVRLAALLVLTAAAPAAAQLTEAGTPVHPPGWSATPAIGVSEMWDDNPTLAAENDVRTGDFVTAVQPSMSLDYRGRQTTVRGDYAGTFDFYRDLTGLNTRDHRAGFDATVQATRRFQVFARDHAMLSPTTADAAEVGATVLRRQTTRMNSFRGGFEALLGKQTTLNGTYASEWIDFADDHELASPIPPQSELLQGGYSHGAIGELRHRLNQRVSIGADYDLQHAIVAGGTETFDVQSALAVSQIAMGPAFSASLGYGHAWLTAGDGFTDNGPAFNVGLNWTGRHSGATLGYVRTFLPSFGFGGTFQNRELRGEVRTSLSRTVRWSGSVALSDNEPLQPGDPTLRTVSARTGLGWIVKRRLRFDAFVVHVSQDSGLAGGHVLRTRAGVQATVSQTVRATR